MTTQSSPSWRVRLRRGALLWVLCAVPVTPGLVTEANGGTSRITWDPNTLTLVAQGGGYGRMIRLRSGALLCCYEKDRGIRARQSDDEGRSWQTPVQVAGYDFGNLANPELLELQEGQLICLYNERPQDGEHPFAIVMVKYDPSAQAWGPGHRLYTADVEWGNGCWEPAAIQLASGEIQVYFSNENPYRLTDEQEITMLRSFDQGCTWTGPQTVCMRSGSRDGMAVPLILQGGRGIVMAIEDNGLSGDFKPVIVYSTLAANWSRAPVRGDSVQRWGALRVPLASEVGAGAPYIRQMPTGHTILSFQTNDGGRTELQMAVCIGDEWARDFAETTFPFDLKPGVAALWNSLCVKDANTITALSGTKIRGIQGLWAIDGHFDPGGSPLPGTGDSEARVVSVWSHSVGNGKATLHRFFSNGFIDTAEGPAKWRLDGDTLTLTWYNPEARHSEWVEQVVLSEDLYSYAGADRLGVAILGKLSQSLGAHPFLVEDPVDAAGQTGDERDPSATDP